jgi:NNP family nitrate/nitrite transporter-like MFS transporter
MQPQHDALAPTPPSDAGGQPAPFRRQLPLLILLSLLFFFNFMGRIALGPLLPEVEADLGIGHGRAGAFFFMVSLGYFAALLGSGFIASRITHRQTIVCSSVVLGAALLLMAGGTTLGGLYPALLLLGLAAGIYLPSALAAITALVDVRHWGRALAVHELAPNAAFICAPLFTLWALQYMSWRAALGVLGVAALVVGCVFALTGRAGRFYGQAPNPFAMGALARQPVFWIMLTLFGLGISATLGVYTMLPLYLVEQCGFDPARANALVSLSRIPTLGTALLAGLMADRLGARAVMVLVFAVSGGATMLLGLAGPGWIAPVVFCQPALAVCFFPAGFAMLAALAPPESRNVAVSMAVSGGFLVGGGLVPGTIGLLADAGLFRAAMLCVGGCIAAGCLPALLLGRARR